ncbi:hypothetical protein LTR56_002505 [Elasticomyces elasticus]|nr:hypothetical protein LTR22_020200 [Elasticomyces elasticus]KAK3657363.1 hypothetical protein LTR56_002505 [Elasticomyces elasticus]KAK4933557.1 hypothetical protein LTR49_000019 [Elasticomyces elasticus]KAK5754801.1 hypothetical protein LTS12_015118 [Elasticomyces elasticus]
MRIPPLSVLLTWPTPNYVDPVTRGNASLVVNVIFTTLVILAVALRFYCRFSAGALRFGWDDAMIALATLCTVAMTAVVILANERYGWDRHLWDIQTADIEKANIIAFVAKLVFTLAATFTRLSLCAFYYRLVKDSGIVWFRWVVHATVAFTVAIGVGFVFLTTFLCTPIPYYWQYPPQTAGHCLDEGLATLAAGILNIVNDLLAALVPIPLVMRLRMPMRQRIGVSVLFGLGFIVIVAGSVRTYYIWKGLMATWDETWYAYPLWIAAAVEIDVGVICACAPALKTLLHFTKAANRLSHPFSSGWRGGTPPLEKLPHSVSTSTKRSNFNATSSLPPWSGNSRSQRDSLPLDDDPWRTPKHKSQLGVLEEPCDDDDEDEGRRPVLEIMRRQSVEMESLRRPRTGSTMSQDTSGPMRLSVQYEPPHDGRR